MLRAHLGTIAAPGIPQAPTVSLTAYADDVTVILQSQEDVKVLSQVIQTYQRAASAKINWEKCSSFLNEDRQDSTPSVLPQRCVWNLDGFKFWRYILELLPIWIRTGRGWKRR